MVNNNIQYLESFIDRLKLEKNKVAVTTVYDNKNYTYAELDYRSDKLATFLKNELNLKKGDVVAFIGRNSIEYLDALYASIKTGIIITIYNFLFSAEDLEEFVEKENVKAVFYDYKFESKFINFFQQKSKAFKTISFYGDSKIADYIYPYVLKYEGDYLKEYVDMEEILMYMHTGGSTGTPKTALIKAKSVFLNIMTQIIAVSITRNDIAYNYLPFFHTAGWNVFTTTVLYLGGTLLLDNDFEAGKAFRVIEKYKPTISMGVPTTYKLMVEHKDFMDTDFSSFRFLVSGAAPAPKKLVEEYLDRGIKFGCGYGMTESGPCNVLTRIENMSIEELREKSDSVGIPLPFNKVKVVLDDACEIEAKPNEIGEILISTELGFKGYLNKEEETKKTVVNNWIKTGDIGKIDKDGFIYIVDRKKRMFISGGENLYPREIETVIEKHWNVQKTYVFSVKDDIWGEVGKSLIVLRQDDEEKREEIKKFLKNNLPKIKVPAFIEFVKVIPTNAAGKISISEIREKYGN